MRKHRNVDQKQKVERKHQHFVPKRYLSAWCDPSLKKKHVWQFAADGSGGSHVAPRKIFAEDEFYTRRAPDGGRDLSLEDGLGVLESRFGTVRKAMEEGRWPSREELGHLKLFTMAMHYRTKAQRDFQREQFGRAKRLGELTERMLESKTTEQLERLPHSMRSNDESATMTQAQVVELATNPMQHLLVPQLEISAPIFQSLDVAVFVTDDEPGFITSDDPCFFVDPLAGRKPPMFRTPSLLSPQMEMSLPISPRLLLVLNREQQSGFVQVGGATVAEVNRRTRSRAQEYIVVSRNVLRPEWFSDTPSVAF